jgi:sugar O-acyltransferase (sialic acid O-acetyltransferase NeuD family)
MTALVGVYGSGGCGRGIMPLLRAQANKSRDRLVFIDDAPVGPSINGHDILLWDQFLNEPASHRAVCLAVANSRLREQLFKRCSDAGVEVIGARAANFVEMDEVEIAVGALISPFVTITSNIRIGRCFHANLYSYVEHDCRIGDFVTFAPAVHCNGNVHIQDHAYLGAGAIIRNGTAERPLVIGEGAVVGMGAVVTKDVPKGATVVGNPARPIVRRPC